MRFHELNQIMKEKIQANIDLKPLRKNSKNAHYIVSELNENGMVIKTS